MITFSLLHYFPDADTEADLVPGMKSVCGQTMTTHRPGDRHIPVAQCPVCAAILERIN